MQALLGILVILLYGIIIIIGIIVNAIKELIKYIKKQKEEKYKEELTLPKESEKPILKQSIINSSPFNVDRGQRIQISTPKIEESVNKSIEEITLFTSLIHNIESYHNNDPRFQSITSKANNIIAKFSHSQNFCDEIINYTENSSDFVSEIINYIAIHIKEEIPYNIIIERVKNNFCIQQKLDTQDAVDTCNTCTPEEREEQNITINVDEIEEFNDIYNIEDYEEDIYYDITKEEIVVEEEEVERFDALCQIISSVESYAIKKIHNELTSFNDIIYHIKLLGHEDPRFQLVTLKAYEIITKFSDSQKFCDDIINYTQNASDFAGQIINFIAINIKEKTPIDIIIKRLRDQYFAQQEHEQSTQKNVFTSHSNNKTQPIYIDSETSTGSRQLTSKAKIAHKHKAIQYANVIGGKLNDEFVKSQFSSFHQFIQSACKSLAAKGDYTITNEVFEPRENIIAAYKKNKKKRKNQSIASRQITPRHYSQDSKADLVLKILDKLTASRLPRYEIPSYPLTSEIIQREYKKESPFDVYNDLVRSEYGRGALHDSRFAILYQLILFISDCVDNGMSEEETIASLSSLRVVRRSDLHILRDREIRFKGLSKKERELVLDSELCNSWETTNLYIDLIHHYKRKPQSVSLHEYIIGVLIKNYKESHHAWILLKYIYLKAQNKTNKFIVDNQWTITDRHLLYCSNNSIKGLYEMYFPLERSYDQLKHEYTNNTNMTHYNFHRDNISLDMVNEEILKTYLPKRFDSQGRLCTPILVSTSEAQLFEDFDKRIVSEHIYIMFPTTSLTTDDLYKLLLTVKKRMNKSK